MGGARSGPQPAGASGAPVGARVVVAGAGVAGAAAARALLRRGVVVTVLDRCASEATDALAADGAEVVIADEPPHRLLDGVREVIVSPGIPPHHPLVRAAHAAGLEVYSEPELAWRLRDREAAPWLAVTGSNGKTTVVTMLAAILTAAGLRTAARGNNGVPLVDAAGYDVLAVELSSQQLHWSRQLAPFAGAWLNLAADHLEWHGGLDAYIAAKTGIWRGPTAIGNLDDPQVRRLLPGAAGRTVGFTLDRPRPGQLGVAGGHLVDHAFAADPTPLAPVDGVRQPGRHNLANALAAAALARAYGVAPEAVAAGLRDYQPQPHRNQLVIRAGGVTYVDDSKATNPHAALGSLLSYPRVVWIAGGQLKGVAVDDLVGQVADRLAGVVLLGVDRARLAEAQARHAPQVPVVEVASDDDGAMRDVVPAAVAMASPGDTVLLAPAAASRDMFVDYAHRGEAFAAAVREVAGRGRVPADPPSTGGRS